MKTSLICCLLLIAALLAAGPGQAGQERCALVPDPGPCKGLFEKYYYNADSQACEVFFYGGCDGVVPFETLAECETLCLDHTGGDR